MSLAPLSHSLATHTYSNNQRKVVKEKEKENVDIKDIILLILLKSYYHAKAQTVSWLYFRKFNLDKECY